MYSLIIWLNLENRVGIIRKSRFELSHTRSASIQVGRDAVPFSRTLGSDRSRDSSWFERWKRRLAGAPSSYCLSAARRSASLFRAELLPPTPRRVGLAQPPSERPRTAPNERRLAAYVAITAELHLRPKDQSSLSRYYRMRSWSSSFRAREMREEFESKGLRKILLQLVKRDDTVNYSFTIASFIPQLIPHWDQSQELDNNIIRINYDLPPFCARLKIFALNVNKTSTVYNSMQRYNGIIVRHTKDMYR